MTSNDLNQIGKLLDEKLDEKLSVTEKRLRTDLKADIGDTEKRLRTDLKADIGDTEKRLRSDFSKAIDERLASTEEHLKTEINASEKRVITEIVDFVHDQLMPLIDDKADKTDIDNVTRRTDYLGDKVGEHAVRLKNIESIPVVAHQLKVKRTK